MSFQRVSARRNYEFESTPTLEDFGFQRVSARRNYELPLGGYHDESPFPACLCT